MTVEFLPVAATEVEEAVAWCDREANGLGDRFRAEVARTLDRIKVLPEGWARTSRRCRRCQLRGFPYGVIYHVGANAILVVAVMHLHRKPGYWHERMA